MSIRCKSGAGKLTISTLQPTVWQLECVFGILMAKVHRKAHTKQSIVVKKSVLVVHTNWAVAGYKLSIRRVSARWSCYRRKSVNTAHHQLARSLHPHSTEIVHLLLRWRSSPPGCITHGGTPQPCSRLNSTTSALLKKPDRHYCRSVCT